METIKIVCFGAINACKAAALLSIVCEQIKLLLQLLLMNWKQILEGSAGYFQTLGVYILFWPSERKYQYHVDQYEKVKSQCPDQAIGHSFEFYAEF